MNLFKKLCQRFSSKKEFPLILVTGAPKTGTTAVYHSIKEQLPADSTCLFEPENRSLQIPEIISSPVLVKSFVPYSEKYDFFNQKILITRDPRDYIISRLLYYPYNIVLDSTNMVHHPEQKVLDELLGLLEKKEKDPHSVSFIKLLGQVNKLTFDKQLDNIVRYHDRHPDIFILRYEDYVDGKLEAVNKYLKLNLTIADKVPEKRVVRSRAYGNWKNWFTPEDIDYFRNSYLTYMNEFGYPDIWDLNDVPVIDPETSSRYVRRLINEANETRALLSH